MKFTSKFHWVGYPLVLMLGMGFGMAGDGTTITPTAVPATVTVTQPPKTVTKPAPPPVTVTVKPVAKAPSLGESYALTEAALELTWTEMSAADRRTLCDGWEMEELQDYFLGIFLDSAGAGFDKPTVKAFFNRKC